MSKAPEVNSEILWNVALNQILLEVINWLYTGIS
jgi:hypothetical protein